MTSTNTTSTENNEKTHEQNKQVSSQDTTNQITLAAQQFLSSLTLSNITFDKCTLVSSQDTLALSDMACDKISSQMSSQNTTTHDELAVQQSTSMLPLSKMTFDIAVQNLPAEILGMVLDHWIGSQEFVLEYTYTSTHFVYSLRYINISDTSISSLPSYLRSEYERSCYFAYKKAVKTFSSPFEFYMTHLLLSLSPNNPLRPYTLPSDVWSGLADNPEIQLDIAAPIANKKNEGYASNSRFFSLHGLEKIRLDFSAAQYFALFKVQVAPFNIEDTTHYGDNLYHDPFLHSSAAFLAQTQHLILCFGNAFKAENPWYDVMEHEWCVEKEKYIYGSARNRPNVCMHGAVIDWILEYAWHGGWLQGIPSVTLEGAIQPWVKEKWTRIFEEHRDFVRMHPGEDVDMHAPRRSR
ncbi:hypothetical protein GMOD_00003517 [Pyrenophora seminiperda CCB06]|uniref:Uncharacterized protein n=1 Tax=Pyrenophora seminiperda CCB06 TaxID=1302712 RepID=A0A3M7MJ63_9PLEO|nr:hypothetical protein GMOD_00003517 [Pyrenophora seminiperda CCB06]